MPHSVRTIQQHDEMNDLVENGISIRVSIDHYPQPLLPGHGYLLFHLRNSLCFLPVLLRCSSHAIQSPIASVPQWVLLY